MKSCEEVRLELAADPHRRDPAVSAHLAQCEACSIEAADLQAFDADLLRALNVAVPEIALPSGPRLASSTLPRPARIARWREPFALVAGVAAITVLAGTLWLGFPRKSIAEAVVSHMTHEPSSWTLQQRLPGTTVRAELAGSGVEVPRDTMPVTSVRRCWFRGRFVPHLVVQQPGGPVTLLVLRQVEVPTRTAFQEDGYRGVIVPTGHGAIAVLAQVESAVDVDAAAAAAVGAVQYVP
jgi:Protein of unknown function (DUF3379)